MNEKKILGVSTIAVIALILIAVASTYAFFKATEAGDGDTPLQVTTNTTDSLVFNVDTDITMVADMSNFTEGAGNREGISHATATLKANNKTNNATGNYYLYFDIKENGLTYTTDDNNPELLLQVSGPDGLVTSISGLNYVTVTDGKGESISGFDITEIQKIITIANSKEITTTSEKVDNWEIKVILVNLNEDQSSNGGKKFTGELIIQKDEYKFPIFADYIKTKVYTGVQGENNIYYHKNLANSAEDESFRYAGSYEDVENYVCFGYDGAGSCPWDNMYRIIGVFDNNIKLIKADYAKSAELGTNGDYYETYEKFTTAHENINGLNALNEIGAYYWNHNNGSTAGANIWANSKLNKENLNGTYLNSFSDNWQSKITMHDWQVGGNTADNIYGTTPKYAYQNEIINPNTSIIYSAKIGLIYMNDYYYAAPAVAWEYHGWNSGDGSLDYKNIKESNWMYGGLWDWTITRVSLDNYSVFVIYSNAQPYHRSAHSDTLAVKPTFYLTPEVTVTGGSGTKLDPYTIK